MITPPANVDELFGLVRQTLRVEGDEFDRNAFDRDQVDELTHGLQCAVNLTAMRPHDYELQIAGLVHDVGHLAVPDDPDDHGRAGAELVRAMLGNRVAELVELHVPAKRYLVTTDPSYRARLSAGSTHTLELQGGELSPDEQAAFEAHPCAADALVLREADEAAKDPHRVVPDIEHWRPIVEAIIR